MTLIESQRCEAVGGGNADVSATQAVALVPDALMPICPVAVPPSAF